MPNVCTSCSDQEDTVSGVQTGPGATALTRMPFSASERASERVKETIAPFAEL